MIDLGNKEVKGIYLGNQKVTQVYLGNEHIYPLYDSEIEYLEINADTGNCGINTGYVPQGDDIDIYCKLSVLGFNNDNQWMTIGFEAYTQEPYICYRILRTGTREDSITLYLNTKAGSGGPGVDIELNKIYEISLFSNYTYKVNDITGELRRNAGEENIRPLYLFTRNNYLGASYVYQRLYAFKLIKGGETIFDMIPVRKDNIGYMYDKVSGKLFGSTVKDNKFALGPDILIENKLTKIKN